MTKEAKLFFWIAVVFMIFGIITEGRLMSQGRETKKEIKSWVDYIHQREIQRQNEPKWYGK